LGVAWAGFRVGKGIIDAGMQMEAMRNRMLAATGDAHVAADALAFVRAEAERLGIGMQTASNGFAGFSASALRAGLTLQQAKDIFTGVSEAAVSMRLPAEQVALVFKALEQIAGKGTVSMEELRGQLGDALPGAFEIAAKSMGKTTAEFSAMVANGEVLAGEFLPKFGDAVRRELGGSVEEAAKGAQAAFNRLGNAFFDLQTQMANSGFLDVVTDGVKDLTAALNDPQTAEGLKGFASMMADIASTALRAASAIGTFYAESDKAIKKAGDSLFSTVFGKAGADAIANARRERSLNQSEDADNARLRQQAIDALTRKYSAQAVASGGGSSIGNYTLGTNGAGTMPVGKKSSGASAQEKAAEQAARLREQMARQVESMRYGFAEPDQQAAMDRDSQQETLREALEAKAITEQEFRDLSLQAEIEYHERLKEIRDSARDEELTSMEAFLGLRLKSQHELNQATLAEQASSFRSSIAEAAKHNKVFFAMEKARAIASALIAARESIVHAYNFGSRIGGPYLGAAFAGVAAAAQAVNIGAIASTSFNSGGGGVSASGSGGSAAAAESGTSGQAAGSSAPGRSVYITLNGDDATFYSKNSIRKLLENMNEALSDGSQLRVAVSS